MDYKPLYKAMALTLNAYHNCVKADNKDWELKHFEKLTEYNDSLPSGSGIDSGCKIDIESSTDNIIIINFGYHFMDENGYYDGWEDYKLIITPSLSFDFDLKIIGKNRNEIKDYFYEMFDFTLRQLTE